MGGSSGIITADTEAEVKRLAREWYINGNNKWGMIPRIDVGDFLNKQDFQTKGCEELHIPFIDNPVICIKPLEEFKDSFYYRILKPEQRDKKFGAIVSAHT